MEEESRRGNYQNIFEPLVYGTCDGFLGSLVWRTHLPNRNGCNCACEDKNEGGSELHHECWKEGYEILEDFENNCELEVLARW